MADAERLGIGAGLRLSGFHCEEKGLQHCVGMASGRFVFGFLGAFKRHLLAGMTCTGRFKVP